MQQAKVMEEEPEYNYQKIRNNLQKKAEEQLINAAEDPSTPEEEDVKPVESQGYVCDACQADVSFDESVCPNCGSDVSEVDNNDEDEPAIPARDNQMTMLEKHCLSCYAALEEDALFCPLCRTPTVAPSTAENETACPGCGKIVRANSKFCKYCAAEIVPAPGITAMRTAEQTANVNAAVAKLYAPAIAIIINAVILVAMLLIAFMMALEGRAGASVVFAAPLIILLSFFVSAFSIYGALQMMEAKKYNVAIMISIFAILSGCQTLVGLPIGIWVLVVLLKPEIKSAFVS